VRRDEVARGYEGSDNGVVVEPHGRERDGAGVLSRSVLPLLLHPLFLHGEARQRGKGVRYQSVSNYSTAGRVGARTMVQTWSYTFAYVCRRMGSRRRSVSEMRKAPPSTRAKIVV
jgi:hypothetical protein